MEKDAAGKESGWLLTKTEMAKRIRDRTEDFPLSQLTPERLQGLLRYWANRPQVKDSAKRISQSTARNHLILLRAFFTWLHTSDQFAWRQQDPFKRIKIAELPEDRQQSVLQVETFSVDELATLYKHATPLVRTFMLLSLNCGFKITEIAGLRWDEVHLHKPHHRAKAIGMDSSPASWIRRLRGKTGVYGEWKLWPETVAALEALPRTDELVLTTSRGTSFAAKTCTGKKPSRVPNLWANLHRTVEREGGQVAKLPIVSLRDTAADLIRDIASGEVAYVFLSHGKPEKKDALLENYSNKPWRKLHKALDELRERLLPMFG